MASMKWLFYIACFFLGMALYSAVHAGPLPNPELTPGAVRTTSAQEICSTRTKTVRNVSGQMKEQVRRSYGYKSKRDGACSGPSGCEIDHLIPLGVGGSNDQKNLWPQSYDGDWNAHDKDILEAKLHRLICKKTITPKEAQEAISKDWIAAYQKWVKTPSGVSPR